jgi:hypothetical protein
VPINGRRVIAMNVAVGVMITARATRIVLDGGVGQKRERSHTWNHSPNAKLGHTFLTRSGHRSHDGGTT